MASVHPSESDGYPARGDNDTHTRHNDDSNDNDDDVYSSGRFDRIEKLQSSCKEAKNVPSPLSDDGTIIPWYSEVPHFKMMLLVCGLWSLDDAKNETRCFYILLRKVKGLLLYFSAPHWVVQNSMMLTIYGDVFPMESDKAPIFFFMCYFFCVTPILIFMHSKICEPHLANTLKTVNLTARQLKSIRFYSIFAFYVSCGNFIVFTATFWIKICLGAPGLGNSEGVWDNKGDTLKAIYWVLLCIFPVSMIPMMSNLGGIFITLPVIFGEVSNAELRTLTAEVVDILKREVEGETAKEKAQLISELFGAQNLRIKRSADGLGRGFSSFVVVGLLYVLFIVACLFTINDEFRERLYREVFHIIAAVPLIIFGITYFILSNLAMPQDCWKELKTGVLLDITLLQRARDIGLVDYGKFIEAHELGIHLAGFLVDTPRVSSMMAFLFLATAGIFAEVG